MPAFFSHNYTLTVDSVTPTISFIDNTPANDSLLSASRITINISSSKELSSALLEWNSTANYTMTSFNTSVFFISHSNLSNGNSTFRVWGTTTAGANGVSVARQVQVNNSPPNITT